MATSQGDNFGSDDTASDFGAIENKNLAQTMRETENKDSVEVELVHHYTDADGKDHLPGDKVSLPRATALSLISGKRAKSA